MRARRARPMRRKRRFRKAFRKGKKTTYDGIYYAKLHTRKAITVDTISTGASMGVHWGINGITGSKDIYIDDNPEFIALAANFSQWRLHGVKIKVTPIAEVTGATGSGIYDIQWATDID